MTGADVLGPHVVAVHLADRTAHVVDERVHAHVAHAPVDEPRAFDASLEHHAVVQLRAPRSGIRRVLEHDDAAAAAAAEAQLLGAKFTGLPPDKTLTLAMEAPENWLVESSVASYDLDNLRLEDLGEKRQMSAEFQLEALMIQGSCSDVRARGRNRHPRGLKMDLVPIRRRHLAEDGSDAEALLSTGGPAFKEDTLVMSNLGYFQLKATPGVFRMRLAPGRSRDLYKIQDVKRMESMDDAGEEPQEMENALPASADGDDAGVEALVAVTSFGGANLQLTVAKRPGMERVQLGRRRGHPRVD